MQWRAGTVLEEVRRWPGAVEYAVALDGRGDAPVRALAYTAMVGEPPVGERVLLNASALLKGLGTGGLAFVVARPDDLPADPPAGPGHIVKARYTPMQQMLLAVDEQDSPHHAELADAEDLGGMPVVVADLHSALPAVLAGIRLGAPRARVAYVMTDGGALPAAFSRAVAGLAEAGWLVGDPHGRPGLRRRPRGGDDPHRAARRTARGRRRRRRRRAGTGQRGHGHRGGATPGSPAPRRCTPPTSSAGAAVASLRVSGPTAASGTAASATTAARHTAGRCSPRRTSRSRPCRMPRSTRSCATSWATWWPRARAGAHGRRGRRPTACSRRWRTHRWH